MRRVVELHWPTLLVGAACVGLALANWLTVSAAVAGLVLCAAGAAAALAAVGAARVALLAVAAIVAGLGWGSLRLDTMGTSALVAAIGRSAPASVVVTGAARRTAWAIRVSGETRSFGDRSVRERVFLLLPVGRSPPRGAIIESVVRVDEPRRADNGFDERAWLARQGIHVVLRASSWRQVGTRGGVSGLGDRLRERIERAVHRGAQGVERGLVLGVVLGEDEGLPEEVRRQFRASGLAHLLAVSGQNVAFLAGGVFGLGWLLRLERRARELLTLATIAGYVLAVGWQPSVVRAGVAGALASLAWLASRPRDRWHFLALGALVLLAWTPATLFEPGFQLSFAAVGAIFVGVPRARSVLQGYPVPAPLVDVLAVAVACGVATAPIVLVHFDRAALYTVVANVLAFPAVPAVLGLGLAAAAVDPVAPDAAASLAWLAGQAAAWLALVARVVAALPGAEIGIRGSLVGAGLAALGVVAFREARRRIGAERHRAVGVLGVGFVLVAAAGWWALRPAPSWDPPTGLRITFLDVGQGDSVLLETTSARVLVDQGPPEADVAGQLARMGVRSLSALVLTHPQRDHVGGAASVIRRLRVGEVLDPALAATGPERDDAIAAARERGVPVRVVRAGARLRIGGIGLHALWPPGPGLASADPNTNALVLVASYGELDVFLPADAESDVTGSLDPGRIEVLKVAHHGSADPGLDEELRVLRPDVAVISAGRDNEYGHPRPETLAALATIPSLLVYRTDLHGTVVVESDGRGLRVRSAG